ncbi:hypothetical protein A9R05_44540 (plasmid) [Burkholderia sp. KK1]|uniref:OmpA/MotB domain-containing protein n=1 Tax=Burkholderia sp. M701 TaxID=326454 RepID=V5YQQ3_9BURK|nr:OmpA family protein [Burkholderia sp. M701]AQH06016.1 hypothetical protein A9R05_44540 [Burkholderia sp. KK1]BAO19256.1 OmpA/MotB domain-containing protein [Burkholderia sp. M701]
MNRFLKPTIAALVVGITAQAWAVDVHQVVVRQNDGNAIEPAHLDQVLGDPNRSFVLDRANTQWLVSEQPKKRAMTQEQANAIAGEEQRIRDQMADEDGSGTVLHFRFDVSTPISWAPLTKRLHALRASGEDISIVGYADEKGTATYNQHLSDLRAQRVESYLVSRGISKSRILAEGRGKRDLVSPGDGAANRRAVVRLMGAEGEGSE